MASPEETSVLPGRKATQTALDLDTRCFRLLKLEPLSFPDRLIQITLEEHLFDDDESNTPPYEAVSYAWGPGDRTHTISVNGTDFAITKNLYALLHHLVPDGDPTIVQPRSLWIDAICIDQYNPHEQSHQVRQMRDIYASASRVIFYLGDPTADTNLVMTALGALDQRINDFGRQHVDELLLGIIWDEVQAELRERFSVVAERQRNGLHDLLQRSWFKRVWIIHEAGNAKEGVVQCGARTVPCETFVLAPGLLKVEVETRRRDILEAMPTTQRATSWLGEGRKSERDLYRLLQKFRNAEATLDRDRIYALLGLCDETRRPQLTVDYKKTDSEIIRDTVAHICGCSPECLPTTLHRDIPSFLENLYSLDSRIFSLLVQSADVDSLKAMLDERHEYIRITQSNFLDAVHNPFCAAQITKILLSAPGADKLHVNEDVFVCAAQNTAHGTSVVQVLLRVFPSDLVLTERVSHAILLNAEQGEKITTLLQEHTNQEVKLTAAIIVNSVKSVQTWRVILPHFKKSGLQDSILRRVVVAAVYKEIKGEVILQSLFDDAAFEVVIDEEVLILAARNITNAVKLLAVMLQYRGGLFKPVSEPVLAACMQNPDQTHQLLDHLEQHLGRDAIIDTLVNSGQPQLWRFIREPFRKRTLTNKKTAEKKYLDQGQPALWWALKRNSVSLARQLISMGANLDIDNILEGLPISTVIRNRNAEMLELLLSSGLDPERHALKNVYDPLLISIRNNDLEIVKMLFHRGIHVDRPIAGEKYTSLHIAAESGHAQIVQFLLSRGATGLCSDKKAGTPLHLASAYGHVEVVRVLLDSGRVEVDPVDRSRDDTPLACAVMRARGPVVELLLERGANVHFRSSTGRTLLHMAAKLGQVRVAKLLLSHGVDVSATDQDGNTAKDLAKEGGHDEVVALLTGDDENQDWVMVQD